MKIADRLYVEVEFHEIPATLKFSISGFDLGVHDEDWEDEATVEDKLLSLVQRSTMDVVTCDIEWEDEDEEEDDE
jgi:hypothetical protein